MPHLCYHAVRRARSADFNRPRWCSLCGRQVTAGELAFWTPGDIILSYRFHRPPCELSGTAFVLVCQGCLFWE